MQTSAPELMDLSQEIGRDARPLRRRSRASRRSPRNCLLARRLVERGVRFVQLYHTNWDSHGGPGENLNDDFEKVCRDVDQASAALVLDLKQRGLLERHAGHLGRRVRPHADGRGPRHDRPRPPHRRLHHVARRRRRQARPASSARPTSSASASSRTSVHVHDLHATILHLLGLDHEQLTYRFQGRDFRLTDVHGHVVEKILA